MIVIGFGVVWVAYVQVVYGYVLLKGYDITWRELANPIHPYQWPPRGQKIPLVPKGQILPRATTQGPAGGEGSGGPINGTPPQRHAIPV